MGAAVSSAGEERRPCVLVVEPDFQIRNMLTEALADEAADVIAARGGQEARAVLGSRPVDVALIELLLPDDDGKSIAEFARGKGCRVVVTSGHPDAIRRAAEESWLFLRKPFGMHEVRRLILGELSMAAGTGGAGFAEP